MPTAKPEIRGLSVVLLGDFNPTIFQPKWFASERLMTDDEAETANVQIIHSDVAIFELPWVSISVERERFRATCLAQPYFERIAGLVVRTFELLRHTPLRMLGINNEIHFRASAIEKWNELGHRLAPKEFWREFFPEPGMQSLTIKQFRADGEAGYTQVTVEPSVKVHPGVYVRVNDHFETDDKDVLGGDKMISTLRDRWVPSSEFAQRVFDRIAEQL